MARCAVERGARARSGGERAAGARERRGRASPRQPTRRDSRGRAHLDARVVLGGERVEDEVRVLVHADQVRRLERARLDEPDDGQKDGLARGGLDHDALALALRVQVDARAVLGGLVLGVDVEDLDDVGDQVGQRPVQLDLLVVLLDALLVRRVLVAQPRRLIAHHLDLVVEQARARDELVVGHRRDLVAHIVVRLAEDVVIRRRHGG